MNDSTAGNSATLYVFAALIMYFFTNKIPFNGWKQRHTAYSAFSIVYGEKNTEIFPLDIDIV